MYMSFLKQYEMKKSVLSIAVIAAIIPMALSCKSAPEQDNSLKVVSYNIRMGVAPDGDNHWDLRKPASPAMIDDVCPDVFGVQEAFDFQLSYLTENCPKYKYVGVGREDGVNEGEQMAIFYNTDKISLEDWGTYWLSETPDVPSKGWDAACYRTATWTLMKVNGTGRHFYYVNTHLDHIGAEARKNGLALIVNKIAGMNPENYPMILTGDLNVFPDDPCLVDIDKIMKSARVYAEDSDTKGSYNGFSDSGSTAAIDYIYYSGFEKCTDFKVIDKTYAEKPFISDHYPVVATLVF